MPFAQTKLEIETSKLDLNQLLIQHPVSSFLLRAQGSALNSAGIFEDDILIVDRQLKSQINQLVVMIEAGELMARFLTKTQLQKPKLEIWGVVTGVVRQLIPHFRYS
ncbi:MAG TPA: hypothetical protein DEP87_04290 [Candidatus Pacebacteria bacterium]|nr:hypothetical protein [Candidatus Paceibacterota bacterium]